MKDSGRDLKRPTISIVSTNMSLHNANTIIQAGETPSFEEHFGFSTSTHPTSTMTSKRYLHLACSNQHYLLRSSFERVRIVSFLVEPLTVERVWPIMRGQDKSLFETSVRDLLYPHVRKDGRSELRGVEVEGNYWAHSNDNVSFFDSDLKFADEFALRPWKRLSVGDVVLVVPEYKRFVVLGGSQGGWGLNVIEEQPEGVEGPWYTDCYSPVVVGVGKMRVVQEFKSRGGVVHNILLLPDVRGVI